MDWLEEFNADKYQEDIPDGLCEESGHMLNFLFRNSPERGDGRMRITKNNEGKKRSSKSQTARAIKRLKKEVRIEVHTKDQCFNPLLKEKVMRREVSCIRGLDKVLGLNLDLFTTETLLKVNPDQNIETRKQMIYPEGGGDLNESLWFCQSDKGEMTLKEYAEYQSAVLGRGESLEAIEEPKEIIFGTNFDLSDEKIWKVQLKELNKMPDFCRSGSKEDLLRYANTPLIGMNTVQCYLKVPGSRTPGHQENNNFCSVNLNIGPGITEWFTVPFEYWEKVSKLCEKHNLKFLESSWWPDLETLRKNKIPVTRFEQLPGDLVFLNIGCVHWVQAKSVCNNIAWNVGPLTVKQFDAAAQRYEYNKMKNFASVVPLKFVCWNLARNFRTSDEDLYRSIKIVLGKSFVQNLRTAKYVEELSVRNLRRCKNGPIQYIDSVEKPFYCCECKEEIFNLLFVKALSKKNTKTYCFGCSTSMDPDLKTFNCLQMHEFAHLINVFDDFTVDSVKTPLF